jgi:NAD(P)-dependent dehydrogenase (short-subunit alcohol dehydrogenase family)
MMPGMPQPSVLVTGASTGIGRATVLHLASRGFRVFASVRKLADGADLPGTAVVLDVADGESIRAAAGVVGSALGGAPLDGLVNNAGIAVSGPLEFLPMPELRHQLEVNVVGPAAVTQAFLPFLRLSRRGRIVNMSSISGRIAAPLLGPYAMSKFALEAFSDALRRELEPFSIGVSVVEPGAIRTPIWEKGVEASKERIDGMPKRAVELYGERIESLRERARQMGERGAPAEEVAKAVHHALVAERPKTRYLVGTDARLTAKLAWLLPDRTVDRMLRRRLRR